MKFHHFGKTFAGLCIPVAFQYIAATSDGLWFVIQKGIDLIRLRLDIFCKTCRAPKKCRTKKTVLCQRPVDTVVYITSIVNCDAVCACIVCMLCLNIPLANKHTCAVYDASVHLEIATSMSKVFPLGKCFSDKI